MLVLRSSTYGRVLFTVVSAAGDGVDDDDDDDGSDGEEIKQR